MVGLGHIYIDIYKGLEEIKSREIERKCSRKEVGEDDNKGTDQRQFCFVKRLLPASLLSIIRARFMYWESSPSSKLHGKVPLVVLSIFLLNIDQQVGNNLQKLHPFRTKKKYIYIHC